MTQAVSRTGAMRAAPKKRKNASVAQEYALIEQYFKPLKVLSGLPALDNDASLVTPPLGHNLAFTTNSLTRGIHFTEADIPKLVAKKALRVNLSDLAAIGATPIGYNIHIHFPKDINPTTFLAQFTAGLGEEQQQFNISLYNAEISQTFKDLVISVTAFGEVAQGLSLARNTAKPGDRIYLTGTVGDSALGLNILNKNLPCTLPEEREYLINRYLLPEPRIDIGKSLGGIATSTIDISDGLLADLEQICTDSKVSAYLNWHNIPWSKAFRNVYKSYSQSDREKASRLFLSGGDDYELLFTVSSGDDQEIEFLKRRFSTPITMIGHLGEKDKDDQIIKITNKRGEHVAYDTPGFQHIWG